MAIVKELFAAYTKGELPQDGGYVVSAFFDPNSTYTKYEVVSFNNVKSIRLEEEGIVFQADGKKLYIIVEPADYPGKHVEPAYRSGIEKIPYRNKELNIYTSSRQDKIMVGKEPVISYTSFTILKSEGNNYSYIFFATDDIQEAIGQFFQETLWKQARVPRIDAQKVSTMIIDTFSKIVVKPAED